MELKKAAGGTINAQDEDFEKLIPRLRPAESIHPESTSSFKKSKRVRHEAVLTEENSYHEFAWEFLRRNRFYQALVDERKNTIPESQWGYQWHINVPRAHGLVRIKPYWERYQENEHPSWMGLDSFAEQLPLSTNMEHTTVEVKLRPGQVVVVFDVGNSIAGQSPWREQSDAIGQRLKQLCVKDFNAEEISGKPVHKSVLLRRIKMFDLLSEGMPIGKAAIELDLTYKGKKKPGRRQTSATNPYQSLMPKRMVTTAYDDASEAYGLVYRHGYMSLLRGERGYVIRDSHLVPYTILYNNDDAPEDW